MFRSMTNEVDFAPSADAPVRMRPRSAAGRLDYLEDAVRNLITIHPVASVRRKENRLEIRPIDEGPSICIEIISRNDFWLSIGGWSDYFPDEETILRLVLRALCGNLRVVETLHGRNTWRHEVHIRQADDDWCSVAELNFPRFSLFRKANTTRVSAYPRPSA